MCALFVCFNHYNAQMKHIISLFRWVLCFFFASTILAVVAYRFLPVYVTPLMVIRCIENGDFRCHHTWVPLSKMSPHMPVAVMASEDQRFLLHHGFDFDAIQKAAHHNRTHKSGRKHGASTITQQTAKNVFLWPSSTWVRKGFEAYFTVLIELLWSKERIMEVYLNSIEMGDGIYGVEAVAQEHFGCHASQLTKRQSALVAASLPNPLERDSSNPSRYMRKRSRQIMRLMRLIEDPKMGCDPK